MGTKLIKDPVHGYIKIRNNYMHDIIDSCEFQRLRNIRQTSYDSLYPGSSHSRFIHSLGVYHLGAKAFEAFKYNVERQTQIKEKIKSLKWENMRNTFELACLLHDVGHTPFSHIGEDFLLFAKELDEYEIMKGGIGQKEKSKICVLYNELLRTMENELKEQNFQLFLEDFAKTIKGSKNYVSGKKVASPHEIMSVIVAVDTYKEHLKNQEVEIDLFARMILGICYEDSSSAIKGIRNALIQMLNSSIIDVDRLDYIVRDTQMSGFDSTTIDIERLLESVTLIWDRQACRYRFGYRKNALSTIVNVVLAHDAERRWIQAHPVVMYDSFLVKKCINAVESKFRTEGDVQTIFQKNAFTKQGVILNNGLVLRLMNDGDFLFLMKQIDVEHSKREYIDEYLSRNERRSPIWKSEAEFRLILNSFTKEQQEILLDTFCAAGEKSEEPSIGSILNVTRIEELEQEIEIIKNDSVDGDEDWQNSVLTKERQLFWLRKLERYCLDKELDFNIYNQRSDAFRSKINSLSELGVEIWYDQFEKSESIKDVLNLYNTNEDTENKETNSRMPTRLFYLYVKKNKKFKTMDFLEFLKETLKEYEKKFIKNF